jgi:hypothetical protein
VDSEPKRMITGRFAAVLFLAFLLVWMPALKIVFYNPKDSLGIADLAIISLGIAACIAIIALLVLWHRTFGLLVIYLLLGLLAAATINTFLVPSDAAVLDGATLAAGISTPKVAITLAVVAGSIAAWFLRDRSAKIVMTTFVAVLAYAVIFSGTALWKTPIHAPAIRVSSGESILNLSPERNILVISFDQMQGSVVAGLIKRHPDIAAKFDGFTVFKDAASVYPNTNYSMASVLTGQMPKYKVDDLDHAISTQNIIRESIKKGYAAGFTMAERECDICLPKYPPGFAAGGVINKAIQLFTVASQQAFGGGDTVAVVMGAFLGRRLGPTTAKYSWKLDIPAFLDTIENLQVSSQQPVVQYRHYYATHQPVVHSTKCKVRSETWIKKNQSLGGVRREVACVLRSFGRLLDKLKEKGIYDQTMIILVSDHGNEMNINSNQGKSAASLLFPGSATAGDGNVKPAGAYNPTLVFKDFGARGQVREVSDHASLLDVSATVCEAIGGCDLALEGQSLRVEIPADRVRRYWRYFGGKEHLKDRYHYGLDEWWEIRSFSGSLVSGLVPSLQQPIGPIEDHSNSTPAMP